MGDLEEFAEGVGADFGEADEHPLIVAVVVGGAPGSIAR